MLCPSQMQMAASKPGCTLGNSQASPLRGNAEAAVYGNASSATHDNAVHERNVGLWDSTQQGIEGVLMSEEAAAAIHRMMSASELKCHGRA